MLQATTLALAKLSIQLNRKTAKYPTVKCPIGEREPAHSIFAVLLLNFAVLMYIRSGGTKHLKRRRFKQHIILNQKSSTKQDPPRNSVTPPCNSVK